MKQLRNVFVIILLTACVSASDAKSLKRLVILHTNDTHSQVEPTAKSVLPTSDMGGYARRMGVIEDIRKHEPNVLLFDAGDFSQGTPYFNFYNGRVEMDALNRMHYDAVTLGNHEFDNGLDTLAVILSKADFPVVCANYDFRTTALAGMTKPYVVLHKFGLKIGVFGLGVNPESLIMERNYRGMIWKNPSDVAAEIAGLLKMKEKCDLIICLSHLGADEKQADNDFKIAAESKYIDLIIGGHSHSMITDTFVENSAGRKVVIAQMGKSGLYMGRIDLELETK